MNETQRLMYSSLISLRNTEVSLRWTRNQIFFLINSAAIFLVATQMGTQNEFYGLACFAGIVLSIMWLTIIFIIRTWVDYWDSILGALESLDGQPIQLFKGPVWNMVRQRPVTAHRILVSLAILFLSVWSVMLGNWIYQQI